MGGSQRRKSKQRKSSRSAKSHALDKLVMLIDMMQLYDDDELDEVQEVYDVPKVITEETPFSEIPDYVARYYQKIDYLSGLKHAIDVTLNRVELKPKRRHTIFESGVVFCFGVILLEFTPPEKRGDMTFDLSMKAFLWMKSFCKQIHEMISAELMNGVKLDDKPLLPRDTYRVVDDDNMYKDFCMAVETVIASYSDMSPLVKHSKQFIISLRDDNKKRVCISDVYAYKLIIPYRCGVCTQLDPAKNACNRCPYITCASCRARMPPPAKCPFCQVLW